MRLETQEARELHARIQTLDAIQSARGDKAKWLAEDLERGIADAKRTKLTTENNVPCHH